MKLNGLGGVTVQVLAAVTLAQASLVCAASAQVQQAPQQQFTFDIPAKPVPQAVNDIGRVTGLSVVFPENRPITATSKPVHGAMTAAQALATLLADTGLTYRFSNAMTVTIVDPSVPRSADDAAGANAITLDTIEVAGEPTTSMLGPPPAPYAGGQVATGGQLGLLGNRDIFNTPFNTTNYTEKTIIDQQARTIGDVIANDPSARVLTSQPNGGETFYIRGFPVANSNVAFAGLYGIYPYWKGSVASAERVEIVKGPGALLFGMAPGGAIGGTVNIVPERAGDEPLTRVIGNYLSEENFGAQIDVGRRFGTDNEFGVRFNGVFRDGESYRDTSQRQGEATLGLDYQGDRFRLSADLGYLNLRYDGTEGLLFPGTNIVPPPPGPNQQIFQPWTYYNSQTWYGVARAEYDIFDNVTAYATVGGRDYQDQYLLPYGSGLMPNGNFLENFTKANEYWNAFSAETGVRARFDTGVVNHQMSVSATTFNQESGVLSAALASNPSNIYDPTFLPEPITPTFGSLPKTAETGLQSIAIADTLSMLEERLQLTLGVRYQKVTAENFNPTTGAMTSSYDNSAVTPAVGLVVKPWENVSFYANYVEGLTQGVIAPAGTSNAGEVFPPFVSKQLEGGVKIDFGKVATTVSLFDITQPSAFNDPVNNTYVVDGEQRNRGVEINVFGELTPGLRVLGGAMFLDAELVNTAGGTFNGNRPTNVPETTVNLGFEWDTPFIKGLTLTARGIYTGSLYANQANTQLVPEWTRFDAGARYTFERPGGKPVTLIANVINVLDESYWASGTLYRGAPRTFMLSTVFDF